MEAPEGNEGNGNAYLKYAGLATQWAAMLLAAVWCGHKLDHFLGWKVPVFVILLSMSALGVSLWKLIADTKKK